VTRRHGLHARAPAPPVVHDVLRSPGRPLRAETRAYLEPRLGHDFGDVRVHTGAPAEASARGVGAPAYTVGRDVVLGAGATGFGVLAHELAHVAQTAGEAGGGAVTIGSRDDTHEREAARVARTPAPVRGRAAANVLRRADPVAFEEVMERGVISGSGFQLFPTEVIGSEVGKPADAPRLVGTPTNVLSAIVGDGLTLHRLAAQLRPLWTTATPFLDDDTGAIIDPDPVDPITIARALAAFNAPALGLPGMTGWRSGFRVMLPVEIDAGRSIAIVYPALLRRLASSFPAAQVGVLGRPSGLTIQPTAPVLAQQATDFLAANPSTVERGNALGTLALGNASASYLLVEEILGRLGAEAFEVALAFAENLAQPEIDVLAAQRDGSTILAAISRTLSAPPGELGEPDQGALGRARAKLLAGIAVPARPTPGRACELGPARDVAIQPVFFRDDAKDRHPTGGSFPGRMDVARQVWAKVGVMLRAETPIVLDDPAHKKAGSTDAEFAGIMALRTGAGLEVFMVDNDLPTAGGGVTRAAAPARGSKIILSDHGTGTTLFAHELGHGLGLNHPGDGTATDGDANTIMVANRSHSIEHSKRNTAQNGLRITWPASGLTCIRPDP
jgi:Domain of unknown function (DUF4157)